MPKRKEQSYSPSENGTSLFISLHHDVFRTILRYCKKVVPFFNSSKALRHEFIEEFMCFMKYRPARVTSVTPFEANVKSILLTTMPSMTRFTSLVRVELKSRSNRADKWLSCLPKTVTELTLHSMKLVTIPSQVKKLYLSPLGHSTLAGTKLPDGLEDFTFAVFNRRGATIPFELPPSIKRLKICGCTVPSEWPSGVKELSLYDCYLGPLPTTVTHLELVDVNYLPPPGSLPPNLESLKTDNVVVWGEWPKTLKTLHINTRFNNRTRNGLPETLEELSYTVSPYPGDEMPPKLRKLTIRYPLRLRHMALPKFPDSLETLILHPANDTDIEEDPSSVQLKLPSGLKHLTIPQKYRKYLK